MSVRENIELYGMASADQLVEILTSELGATKHPNQADAYIVESLPFYVRRLAGDHVSILRFHDTPLPNSLVEVLVVHAELFPDDVLVWWIQEQDLIFEGTFGQLRGRGF